MSDENNLERELKDRLIDQALRERLGKDQPRDLTDKIIKQVAAEKPMPVSPIKQSKVRKYSGYEIPLAISIVLVVGLLTVPQLLKNRPGGGDRMLGLATEEVDDAATDSLSAIELGSPVLNEAEVDESRLSRFSVVDGYGVDTDEYGAKLKLPADGIVNESLDTYNVPTHEQAISEKGSWYFYAEEHSRSTEKWNRELKATDRIENPNLRGVEVRNFGIVESNPASPVADDGLNRLSDSPDGGSARSGTNDWIDSGGAMGGGMAGSANGNSRGFETQIFDPEGIEEFSWGEGEGGDAFGLSGSDFKDSDFADDAYGSQGETASDASEAEHAGGYGDLDVARGKSPEALFSGGGGGALSRNKKQGQLYDDVELEQMQGLRRQLANVPKNADRRYVRPEALGLESQFGRDRYARIHENPFFEAVGAQAMSTFAIDVDTAAYTNVRQFLLQSRRLPPPNAVRLEEMLNYFDYDYKGPDQDAEQPFAANVEVTECPWTPEHRLVRVGIKGREIEVAKRPLSNLVFLVDVSGSMNQQNKLPLVIDGLRQMVRELGENDRVAIVVYASAEGLALPSTTGEDREQILASLENLRAGGSTAGGAGIQLAYQTALDNFIKGGSNRVILCTDGDFNVGVTDNTALETMVTDNAKTGVFLTVIGFGRGNLNDQMMEGISNKGNGNYYYVDTLAEARKVLVQEMSGTLVTIAKDVKIQVEFNPAEVAGYRLIGYENRVMANADFRNDKKDAGEIGAGHTVTAMYEVVPAGLKVNEEQFSFRYQKVRQEVKPVELSDDAASGELLTVRLRYKKPDGDTATESEFAVKDEDNKFGKASKDFKFSSAVASFGMLLRNSKYKGNATFDSILEIATDGCGDDKNGHRAEFLELVRVAKGLQQK